MIMLATLTALQMRTLIINRDLSAAGFEGKGRNRKSRIDVCGRLDYYFSDMGTIGGHDY